MTFWRALLLATAAAYGVAVLAVVWMAYPDALGLIFAAATGLCSAVGWYELWEDWI